MKNIEQPGLIGLGQLPSQSAREKRKQIYLPLRTWGIILILLLLVGAGGAYEFGKYRAASSLDAIPDNKTVLDRVGKHMLLPKDVTPKIGKIVNPDEFKNDPFLSQALVGDEVLFYPYQGRTVKAILFRPSEDRVVDVALVSIPEPDAALNP